MNQHIALALGDYLARTVTKAVTEAIGKTFDLAVTPGRYEINHGAVALSGDVSGLVGITQEGTLEGTLTVCFKTATIRNMLPRLLGDDVPITSEVVMDAVGEITNMIFGQVKTELNERGYKVRFGLPSVVSGSGHFIGHMHQGRYMIIPFDLQGTPFHVHLAVHPDSLGAKA